MPVGEAPDPDGVAAVADMVAAAQRPALLVGTDVYWDGAWDALGAWVEAQRLPAFANGLGRGCLPADHKLFFFQPHPADAALRCRLGDRGRHPARLPALVRRFGDAQVVHLTDSSESVSAHAQPAAAVSGDLVRMLTALADGPAPAHPAERDQWVAKLRDAEDAARADEEDLLATAADPILPTRVYGGAAPGSRPGRGGDRRRR